MFALQNIELYFLVKILCRTPCQYPGKNIAFRVNEGSTNFWLSLLVEFEDGDGDVGSMHIRQVNLFIFEFPFFLLEATTYAYGTNRIKIPFQV